MAQEVEIYDPPPEAPPTAGAADYREPAEEGLEPSAFDLAWAEWSRSLWCALLEDDSPGVRVLASLRAEMRGYGQEPLSCSGDGTAFDTRAVRERAIGDESAGPATLARVFIKDCTGTSRASWCDAANLVDRLIALDPGNAYPQLLALQGPSGSGRGRALPFSNTELEHLLRAASSERVDGYWGDGYPEAWRAISAAVDDLPPLVLDDAARAAAAADDIDPSRPADLAAAEIIGAETGTVAGVGRLFEGCSAGIDNGDDIVVRGCRALGELLQNTGRSDFIRKLGVDLVALGLDAEQGGNGDSDDSDWQRRVPELVRVCASTRGLPTEFRLPGPMPADHLSRFLEALEARGESAARLEAATREFERYPEAFPLDPRRCADIAGLDGPVLRGLVDRWEEALTRSPDDWDTVLRAAARALDAP
jgi:hypothetical protein